VDAVNLALKDRICDATDRIPTARWPFYSQTLKCQIPIGELSCTVTLEAERDLLLTDLSAFAAENDDVALPAFLDIEYCNIAYAENTDIAEFGYCCQRKPIFLVGVRENKKLKVTVTLSAVQDEIVFVEVTFSGFQGDGCCS
jgi:hypothetical protein